MTKAKTLLFCAGAKNPDLTILYRKIDITVGVDGGAQVLKDRGVQLDFAIGDFDTVDVVQATDVVVLPAEKDETDLQYALTYVLEKFDCDAIEKIYIIGALGGGRLDHLICNFYLAYQPQFKKWLKKMYFFEQNNVVQFLLPGSYTIEKMYHYLSIISMTPVVQLSIADTKYTLQPTDIAYPVAYISNEFIGKPARICFGDGIVCVMQTTDRMQ